MAQRSTPPDGAAVEVAPAGRLCAPAALRNAEPLTALLAEHAPPEGEALELASGTGQHIAQFAKAFPGLTWQPSELDPARLASIAAWTDGMTNMRAAITLDATAQGWGAKQGAFDLILTVNLLHLIDAPAAQTLIHEAARALKPRGRLIIYGPFLRGGRTISPGDAQFHASLTAADPRIGYKDDFDVVDWLHAAQLTLLDLVEMPANNLAFIAERGS